MTDLTSSQFALPVAGKLGRLPVKPVGERFPLNWAHDYLLAPLAPPVYPIDVTGGITDLGMLGNDSESDCGEAGLRHVEMTTAVAAGLPVPVFTTQEALDEYHEYLSFVQGVPVAQVQDNGVVLADFLLWLFNKGRIKGFAPADHTNKATCDSFMAAAFGLYCGASLTSDAQTLFPNGVWTTAQGQTPNPEMGHCIEKVKAATDVDAWGTWGAIMPSTAEWTAVCLDEVWVVLTTEEQLAKFNPQLILDIEALGGKVSPAAPAPVPVPAVGFVERVEQIAREEITALEAQIAKIRSAVGAVGGSV